MTGERPRPYQDLVGRVVVIDAPQGSRYDGRQGQVIAQAGSGYTVLLPSRDGYQAALPFAASELRVVPENELRGAYGK